MKRTLIIIAATIFSTAVFAGDNESPIRGKGAFSVVHNEPASNRPGYTSGQINNALASLQRCCELGTGRVLFNEKAREYESTKTYTETTTTYHSQSK